MKDKSAEAVAEKMTWFILHSSCIKSMGIASRELCAEKFEVDHVNLTMLEIMGIK